MDRRSRLVPSRPTFSGRLRRVLGTALIALTVLCGLPDVWLDRVEASAIYGQPNSVRTEAMPFLRTGQSPYPVDLAVPGGITLLPDAEGFLPSIPLVDYLHFRRSRNIARFDFNHPSIGPRLADDLIARSPPEPMPIPTVIPEPVVTPTVTPTPPVILPQTIIPEPTTGLIFALLVGGGLVAWTRRRAVEAD